MKRWARERDLLVEQTMAFVEGIAGPTSPLRAALAMRMAGSTAAASPGISAPVVEIISQSPAPPRLAIAEYLSAPSVETTPAEKPISVLPPAAQRKQPEQARRPMSERDQIRLRVDAFKARQQRFQNDRARHCDEILQGRLNSQGTPICVER